MEGKRLELLSARHKKEVNVQQPVPVQDDRINESMFQKVEDWTKDDVRSA